MGARQWWNFKINITNFVKRKLKTCGLVVGLHLVWGSYIAKAILWSLSAICVLIPSADSNDHF